MEIPKNDYSFEQDKEIQKITKDTLERLQKEGVASFFKASYCYNLEKMKYVARQFVKKGYYAKVVYFCGCYGNGWQSVHISKEPLAPTNARAVYSEAIV